MTKDDLITREDLKRAILDAVEELKGHFNQHIVLPNPPKKKFYRNRDIKEIFAFSENKIRDMRKKGLLPSTKLGGIYLYDVDKINKLLDSSSNNFPLK